MSTLYDNVWQLSRLTTLKLITLSSSVLQCGYGERKNYTRECASSRKSGCCNRWVGPTFSAWSEQNDSVDFRAWDWSPSCKRNKIAWLTFGRNGDNRDAKRSISVDSFSGILTVIGLLIMYSLYDTVWQKSSNFKVGFYLCADLFDKPFECPIKAALLRVFPPQMMITAPSVAKVNVGAVLRLQ